MEMVRAVGHKADLRLAKSCNLWKLGMLTFIFERDFIMQEHSHVARKPAKDCPHWPVKQSSNEAKMDW